MTTVPKRKPGRCPGCSRTFQQPATGRPKTYCSDACRKRVKRMLADDVSGRLGKRTTEFPTPSDQQERTEEAAGNSTAADVRKVQSQQRRAQRYAGRRTLWKISNDRTCRGCGRTAMDPDSGVILARTAEGTALALGLLKCGKIWLCPVCSAKIRHGRSEEVTKAAVAWIQRGGTCFLVTFTARHAAAHRLADLMDAIQGTRADADKGVKRKPGAYQRLISGGTWAGRPDRGDIGIKGRSGFIGMIRATEITLSQRNGWHPHIHALVFLGGLTEGTGKERTVVGTFDPSAADLAELENHFRSVWTRHLAKVDKEFTPSDEYGVDFKRLETVQDAEDFGAYLAKTQDGKDPAKELTRADLKRAKGENMTPFQMLGRIGDLMGGVLEKDADGHGSLTWCLTKWAEYETATKGRRAIEWTRFLRAVLGIEGDDSEETDLDILFEMDAASPLESGVRVETRAWHKVTGRALDLAAVEAVEADELDQVAELVEAAGGRAGAVKILNGAEIEEAWQATLEALAKRREQAATRRKVEEAGK